MYELLTKGGVLINDELLLRSTVNCVSLIYLVEIISFPRFTFVWPATSGFTRFVYENNEPSFSYFPLTPLLFELKIFFNLPFANYA